MPYSVAAEGPFTISMLSISSGFRSFVRLVALPPVPGPDPMSLVMRTPSMIQIGSLDSESEFAPRIRMRAPVPVCVPSCTDTPGVRAFSTSWTLAIGAFSVMSATVKLATALPISTRRVSPVAVVTTGVRLTATAESVNSTAMLWPAATSTTFFCSA